MEENTNDGALHISVEDMARMVMSAWDTMKEDNEWEFGDDESEDYCKMMFIYGYYNAWIDMSNLSSGLDELDEIIKKL